MWNRLSVFDKVWLGLTAAVLVGLFWVGILHFRMVAHDAYRALDLAQLRTQVARPVLVDGRHVFAEENAVRAGWYYHGVGTGIAATDDIA